MKILFVEPPKDYWFVMGEYLPPPYGILQLAAYLEHRNHDAEIQVLDCNAEGLNWNGLEKHIEAFNPDFVASSALSTCNTYVAVRTLEIAKKVKPDVLTVAGGQHFTAMAQESLETYPEIDVIVRGEGEYASLGQLVSEFLSEDEAFRATELCLKLMKEKQMNTSAIIDDMGLERFKKILLPT